MNPNDGATDIVEQVHFGWKPDGWGLQAVASSMSMEFARNWYETLKIRIRLESLPHLVTPSEALSYLVFDSLAVVVWRCDDGDTAGRNSARALIGSPKILTPELATTLTGWGGWRVPPETNVLAPVYADDLVVREETRQDFADQARIKPYPALVCAVLARMLAEPGRPVSIVGPSALKPEVVVWALRKCGSLALADFKSLRWTFSTWEVRHDAQAGPLPEIVFLPETQVNPPSSINRIQVALRGWAPTSQDQLAQAWFDHCFSNEPRPVDPRVAIAHSSPTPTGVQIPDFPGSTVEPVLVRTSGGPEEDAARMQPQRVPAHAAAAAGSGSHSVRTPAAEPESEALAARLASATTLGEFTTAIAQIPSDAKSRGDVRKAILKPDVLSGVTLFLEETASADLAKTLTQALFGPDEDLRLDSPRVAKLIQGGQSTALARHLTELGLKQGDALAGEVARSAALRLTRRGEPADTPTRMRGIAARVALRYSDRRFGWAAALAAVALLVAAFLGGMSLSRGNGGQTAETAAQLQHLQASVDALPQGQPVSGPGQATPAKPLTTLPWTVSGPPPPFKVALVVVDQTDKKAHGVECQPTGGPTPPGAVLWKCGNAPSVGSPGAVTIMAWPGDKPPADLNGPITPEELRNATVVFNLG